MHDPPGSTPGPHNRLRREADPRSVNAGHLEDPTINNAASWSYINSSAESDVDQVGVFFRGQELPVQGRFAAFLER